ncbi:ABC-type nitrate/sulfonate/bicarbonate transport system, ATPase component [Methyloglobulus morosus KoM1]|uniref:ABC-type nitrate/sulfonate/bicarbonate transport system, ATPase component n=1 Tax=Methyloglobulus morosus KoM1 TaxID=1116472 RepID=V5C5P9_9GAMM|nr:ATP-binding cassette domain-containing protein [Methyloglobulus morosus]ESS72053.1 ABC-type nitrate/sulfonate/bicarbonate transport system, ATPase component [Methyloglobulus morosus KoM1]
MRVEGLSFSYGNQAVFEGLNFASESRIVGLSGPPGCGKTTLLKILAGHLTPNYHVVLDVPSPSTLVLQEDALLPWLTVMQNLELVGFQIDTFSGHPLWGLVDPLLTKRPNQMSFGQRRTVELYRAIVNKPPLLCLDEPFNFIDLTTRNLFMKFLMDKYPMVKIVMSTHHVDELVELGADILKFPRQLPISAMEG